MKLNQFLKDNLIVPQITITGRPITKKNGQQIVVHTDKKTKKKRYSIIQSEAYLRYEKKSLKELIKESNEKFPVDFPINMAVHYYMPTKGTVDLNNLLEATTDILEKAKIIQNDNSRIIVSHDYSRVFYDKENPRAEIFITHPFELPKNLGLKQIVLDLPPRAKKNNCKIRFGKGTRKGYLTPSDAYLAYQRDCLWLLSSASNKKHITGNKPVNLAVHYYMPTKGIVDLNNLLQATMDILKEARYIEDDNSKIVASHDYSRVFYDKEKPRAEIFIQDLSEVDITKYNQY